MNKEFFLFDTYSILEIINGNKNYEAFFEAGVIINDFIFAELCYKLFRENADNAEEYIKKYAQFITVVEPEVIKEAMQFRINNIKKNLSMTDCISYVMAKKMDIKFLTGDKEFEGLDNVEFVK